jgi:murein DD-endopeptidase MepM/ murein hydrolase activator NlpD
MDKVKGGNCGWRAAAACIAAAGLLTGCGQASRPAPVVAATPQAKTVTIEHGQTLSGIAETYRVPMRELAEANRLSPPYRILAGSVLVIPAAGAAPAQAALPTAAPPAAVSSAPAAVAPVAVGALPTAPPVLAFPAPASRPPVLASPAPPTGAVALASPAPRQAAPLPETVHPASLTPPQRSAPPQSAAAESNELPPARGAVFQWPVRGRILAGYGAGPDGSHNDGINIAAPRGAPIEAVDGGVVAYAGNELRGYGNLILIKHPNGWISAYAHCDLIVVKRGQKVARGQVIARVGATGNISTPQLHFELRRGDKPVDPRTHLAPLPSTAAASSNSG